MVPIPKKQKKRPSSSKIARPTSFHSFQLQFRPRLAASPSRGENSAHFLHHSEVSAPHHPKAITYRFPRQPEGSRCDPETHLAEPDLRCLPLQHDIGPGCQQIHAHAHDLIRLRIEPCESLQQDRRRYKHVRSAEFSNQIGGFRPLCEGDDVGMRFHGLLPQISVSAAGLADRIKKDASD